MIEAVRSLVRPALTLMWLAGALLLLFTDRAVPDWYIAQGATIIAWWFADRSHRETQPPPKP